MKKLPVIRLILVVTLAIAGGLSLSLVPAVAKAGTSPTVVELFTSEGCSSCPPAEALLRKLADEPGILALEFHVDYWDYIGWPDPYADPDFTQRQRKYAQYFSSRTVYTPQMVFQGVHETPGSRTSSVREKIKAADALPRIPVTLEMTDDNQLGLKIAAVGQPVMADLLLVTYDAYRETEVTRGENAGKFLTHRNVVRSLESIGTWNGAALQITRPLPQTMSDRAGCAVLVQAQADGRILGAASLALMP